MDGGVIMKNRKCLFCGNELEKDLSYLAYICRRVGCEEYGNMKIEKDFEAPPVKKKQCSVCRGDVKFNSSSDDFECQLCGNRDPEFEKDYESPVGERKDTIKINKMPKAVHKEMGLNEFSDKYIKTIGVDYAEGYCQRCGEKLHVAVGGSRHFCVNQNCDDCDKIALPQQPTTDARTMADGIAQDIVNHYVNLDNNDVKGNAQTLVDMIAMLIDARIELHGVMMKPIEGLKEKSAAAIIARARRESNYRDSLQIETAALRADKECRNIECEHFHGCYDLNCSYNYAPHVHKCLNHRTASYYSGVKPFEPLKKDNPGNPWDEKPKTCWNILCDEFDKEFEGNCKKFIGSDLLNCQRYPGKNNDVYGKRDCMKNSCLSYDIKCPENCKSSPSGCTAYYSREESERCAITESMAKDSDAS